MEFERITRENDILFRLKGRLDIDTVSVFEKEISEKISGKTSAVLDFEKLEYISSAGLRCLLHFKNDIEKFGGTIKIVNVIDEVKEVFDITGFLDIFEFE